MRKYAQIVDLIRAVRAQRAMEKAAQMQLNDRNKAILAALGLLGLGGGAGYALSKLNKEPPALGPLLRHYWGIASDLTAPLANRVLDNIINAPGYFYQSISNAIGGPELNTNLPKFDLSDSVLRDKVIKAIDKVKSHPGWYPENMLEAIRNRM